MKMFQHIQTLVADERSIIFVLIDEVERWEIERAMLMDKYKDR